jgi:hypothetical protein
MADVYAAPPMPRNRNAATGDVTFASTLTPKSP